MTMSKGIVALFSTSGRPVAPFVHLETGTTFSIPYVTTGPSVDSSALAGAGGPATGYVTDSATGEPASSDGENMSLHVRPLNHGAMLAVIRRHGWTVVYYLYDSDQGIMRWYLQLRVDFDSTAVRLFMRGHQGHSDVTS